MEAVATYRISFRGDIGLKDGKGSGPASRGTTTEEGCVAVGWGGGHNSLEEGRSSAGASPGAVTPSAAAAEDEVLCCGAFVG